MFGSSWWVWISGISSHAISSPAHKVLSSAHTKMCNCNYKASQWFICAGETLTKQEKLAIKNGMWQIGNCARAFQARSSPPFYQLAKRKKIALGPAVKKAYHSQRETYQFGGFLQQLCIFTNTIGKGLQGVPPRSPAPPNSLWRAASGVGTRTCPPARPRLLMMHV